MVAEITDSGAAGVDRSTLPFVAPCRDVPASAPLRWLRLGWQDLRRAPGQSLVYGAIIALLSIIVTAIGLRLGSYWAVLILLSGFVFVAPVLALGLYSISRQIERGDAPSCRRCLRELRLCLGTAMVFALALLVVFLIWMRAGSLVHVFFPDNATTHWSELLAFFAIGSAVGSLFVALTFVFSAFSLPMISDRDTDAITAIVTSVNAVLRNKRTMLVWALLIVALTALAFATAMLGMAVIMPVLGHATWHAYRETIDASAWPALNPILPAQETP